MAKKLDEKTKKLTEELLELLGVTSTVTATMVDTGDEPSIDVVINSEKEAGLLIGGHGATLLAIQSFLSMALKQETGDWVRVSVDVDGWREKQEDYLKELAEQAAQRAKTTGQTQNLYNLNPNQRRIVHTALSEMEGITTESLGEGEGRYLVVKPE